MSDHQLRWFLKMKRILATVKSNLISTFEKQLKEGSAFIISNFGMASNDATFKVVDHKEKLWFYKGTMVENTNDFHSKGDYYRFVDFHSVSDSSATKTLAFDVIGRVVSTEDLKVLKVFGSEKKLIKCDLQDMSGEKVSCALWDEFALQLQSFIQQNSVENNPVIILIQLGKFSPFNNVPQVSNNSWSLPMVSTCVVGASRAYWILVR